MVRKYLSLIFIAWGSVSVFAMKPFIIPTGPHIAQLQTNPITFMAPVGCTNVALHKHVSVPTNSPGAEILEKVTDGNKSCDAPVALPKRIQWMQIDLEQPCELYAIVIWRDYYYYQVCRGVVVQAADDPDFKVNVVTLFNNDYQNLNNLGAGTELEYPETIFGKIIDTHGIKARYLRFYCRGSSIWSGADYIEVEAWGFSISQPQTAQGTSNHSTNATSHQLAPLPIKYPPPPFI